MRELRQLISDPDDVIRLEPDELAGYVLEILLSSKSADPQWFLHNFCIVTARSYVQDGQRQHTGVMQACAEAWGWLEINGLICPDPAKEFGWYSATRRGHLARDRQGVRALISSRELPAEFLHPEVVIRARPLFLQGRLETAVFEAFKSLEVEIRKASGFGNDLYGVALANRAFSIEDGPLTDLAAERGEREALRSLMAGALGSYKNPTSHRRVELTPAEAREMIMLASHLLQIVQARRAARAQASP